VRFQSSAHSPDGQAQECNALRDGVGIASELDTSERLQLERLGKKIRVPLAGTIFTQGNVAGGLFILSEGIARLYRLMPEGRRVILGFMVPGDILGLSMDGLYDLSADALTEIVICEFPKETFLNFVRNKPRAMQWLKTFAVRERTLAQDQVAILGYSSAEQRLSLFFSYWSDRSKSLYAQSRRELPLPMSRRDIADFLGLSVETVSRAFSRLTRSNGIKVIPGGIQFS
jgi:CRP/FNR family transcriptional regulator